jgi:hypothetical protein
MPYLTKKMYFCRVNHFKTHLGMALSDNKKRELYEYYSQNGFRQPMDKIAESLEICHKTFFNRYGNKAKSVEIAWEYWQGICKKKWITLMQHCNHSVEALTVTVYHFRSMNREDPHFYELTRDKRLYLDANSFFYTALKAVLERGKQCFHIHEKLNEETYIQFLLNNLFQIDVEEERRPDVLRYVLLPALTERGMELFMETPFA